MSTFGDYKAYKKFAPSYNDWKQSRDLADVKRQEYLRKNPSEINNDDIQRSRTLLRAIDVMDEYSQKRAEDMEVATETVVGYGLELASMLGMGVAALLVFMTPLKNVFKKYVKDPEKLSVIMAIGSMLAGGIGGTLAAFPLFAWAAKAEVKASRKGRFEAMRKELSDAKTFAVLNEEQENQLRNNLVALSTVKEKKNPFGSFKEKWNTFKSMVTDSPEYQIQKIEFDNRLKIDEAHWDKELTEKEIEDAKRNQQLLTKLVEKIDIASQDYAENAELATAAVVSTLFGMSSLFTLLYEKIAGKMGLKKTAVPMGLGMLLSVGASIICANIQKQASRVGRFKIKQELLKNPEQLVYVSDEKTNEITDVKIEPYKKLNVFKFLKEAYKNNKEFEKWKKTEGAKEKQLAKAMENIEISEEQLKDARLLQHSTFKTFNKVDENSQKYSESIEALGQAIQYPISMICGAVGLLFGMKHLTKAMKSKTQDMTVPMLKYISAIFLSILPSFAINAYVTKEQKKASRVADMIAINEMQDYRHFADYSRYRK